MLLYEAPGSPYAQKIKIALREKGLAFEIEVPESLGTGRTDNPFGTGNPRAEVPLLVDGQTRIFESTIILEYIEERWPDSPLLARSPEARATARMTEDVCDAHYEAVTWGFSEVMAFGRATGARAAAVMATALIVATNLREKLIMTRNSKGFRISAGRSLSASHTVCRAEG
jgi:glutathione S-transferase